MLDSSKKRIFRIACLIVAIFLGASSVWAINEVLIGGDDDYPDTTAVEYNTLTGGNDWSNNASANRGRAPTGGTLKNLYVYLTAGLATGSYVFTVTQGTADTLLACTINTGEQSCNDTSHTVTVTANDRLSLSENPGGTNPDLRQVAWSTMFVATNARESILLSNCTSVSTTGTDYCGLTGRRGASGTESDVDYIVSADGTIKNFYMSVATAPGGTTSRTFTVRTNDTTNTALTCTILGTETTCGELTSSVAIAAGDTLTVSAVVGKTPAATGIGLGLLFVANIDGEYMMSSSDDVASGTGNAFQRVADQDQGAAGGTESNAIQIGQTTKITKMYVNLGTAPGAGTSRTFTYRVNGVDSNLTCTVSGTAKTCIGKGSASVGDGDYVTISNTKSATAPTGGTTRIGTTGWSPPRRIGSVD